MQTCDTSHILAEWNSASAEGHFYFAHEIHQQPDFDHVVHGVVSACVSASSKLGRMVNLPGASWEVLGTPNTLDYRLVPGQV